MTRVNRASTYSGEEAPALSISTIEKVIRESAGEQMPPGAVPEDRVAPSTQDGDVTSTVNGKTVWVASEDLSGVIAANSAAALAQAAADDAAADAVAAQAAADQAADDAASVGQDLTAHITDTTAHPASNINITDAGGNYTAENVEDALDEAADALLAHVNDTGSAHLGSAIEVNPSGLIVVSGTNVQSAISQLDAGVAGKVSKSGDTMSGALAMGSNKITGLAAATANGDAVRYEQAILQSLLTTRGDLIRRGASAPERVALGADGSVLASDGTDAIWQSDPIRTVGTLALQAAAFNAAGAAANTYVLNADSAMSAPSACANCPFFKYTASQWQLPDGRFPKFYLLSTITPNGANPGGSHTCYVSQLASLGGGAGVIAVTYSGSPPITNSHGTVTAGNINMQKSSAVSLTDGQTYMLTYANSATLAASSYIHVSSRLYAVYD